jgi:hypothetical protein
MWYLGEAYEKGEGVAKVKTYRDIYTNIYLHCLNAWRQYLPFYTHSLIHQYVLWARA